MLLFHSACVLADVSRTCGIGSLDGLTRAPRMTLFCFAGSLRPCISAPLRFPRGPFQRKDARTQRCKESFVAAARASSVAERTSRKGIVVVEHPSYPVLNPRACPEPVEGARIASSGILRKESPRIQAGIGWTSPLRPSALIAGATAALRSPSHSCYVRCCRDHDTVA